MAVDSCGLFKMSEGRINVFHGSQISYLLVGVDMPDLPEALQPGSQHMLLFHRYLLNSRRLTWIVATTLRLRAALPVSRRSTRHDGDRKGPALLLE